jgi:hypothetical protein
MKDNMRYKQIGPVKAHARYVRKVVEGETSRAGLFSKSIKNKRRTR